LQIEAWNSTPRGHFSNQTPAVGVVGLWSGITSRQDTHPSGVYHMTTRLMAAGAVHAQTHRSTQEVPLPNHRSSIEGSGDDGDDNTPYEQWSGQERNWLERVTGGGIDHKGKVWRPARSTRTENA
jgi:hypothetical protein